MFVERRLNPSSHVVELWQCEWRNEKGKKPEKVFLKKICDEQTVPVVQKKADLAEVSAICWAYGRTLGNIAVQSQSFVGLFPDISGDDAQLPCDFVPAGKYRYGVDRWWASSG